MPGIIRDGDKSTSDPCGAPPRPASSYSSNVFVNGKAAVRRTDSYISHACPSSPPHNATATGSSSTVLINSLGVHRIGDAISCGSFGANGSSNVLAG